AEVGGGDVLHAFTHHDHMSEPELTDDGRKERHAALLRLDEREPEVRPDDRHRNPGDAGAGPYVDDVPRFIRERLEKAKAVDEHILDQPRGFHRTHEAMSLLPFSQCFQIVVYVFSLAVAEWSANPGQGSREQPA